MAIMRGVSCRSAKTESPLAEGTQSSSDKIQQGTPKSSAISRYLGATISEAGSRSRNSARILSTDACIDVSGTRDGELRGQDSMPGRKRSAIGTASTPTRSTSPQAAAPLAS